MGNQRNRTSMRRIAARRDGYRCCYCRVPTGATIEHLKARTSGGSSWMDNLKLACPYCNRKKGTRPIDEFLARELWRIDPPEDLPGDARQMLKECFGWENSSGLVATGSTNSKLELKGGELAILVRTDKATPWFRYPLGASASPAVSAAAWDFLTRHDTPGKPQRKRYRPPRSRKAIRL